MALRWGLRIYISNKFKDDVVEPETLLWEPLSYLEMVLFISKSPFDFCLKSVVTEEEIYVIRNQGSVFKCTVWLPPIFLNQGERELNLTEVNWVTYFLNSLKDCT